MLKINIVCVGNLKDKFYKEASEEYLKMLSRFCNVKIIELKEYNHLNNIEEIKNKESENILQNIKGYCVLCDINAEIISSENLAKTIQELTNTNSEISFIIGGSNGVSQSVKEKVNQRISFGKMTFPHRLFRVMLLEQLYRAQTIINNTNYHK